MADVFFTVGAEVDDAQVAAEAGKAGKTFGSKFTQSSKAALGNANELFKDVEASIKRIRGFQANIGKTGLDPGQFAPLARGLDRLLALQREFARDRERLSHDRGFLNLLKSETDAVQALTSSQTRELQSTVAATNVRERAAAHAADREAAARNIALQRDSALQVNAARTAGKARIVLAQQIGAQLLSFERILSNGITNIVRGTGKAVGKVWDSTVGSLRRSFSERRTVIEGGLRNESRLFTQSTVISQRANQGILGTIGNNLGTIGGGFALGAAARQIFTLGSEFTRGLNVMQAQLQLTDAQMEAVSDQAIQLGNDIKLPGVSALDAANAIGLLAKQFASLGAGALPAAQAAAKGTLQLARAVGAAPEEAAAAVGAAVNVFGENAANATQVADQLTAALSQAAGTSFSDFSQAFTQGAAVVSSFIVPADGATNAITEFSAALAVLARGGLVGSDAGTSIKQFFLQANRGTDDVNTALAEVSARAGETGTAFFTAEGKARPLVQTIDILQRGLAGLTEEQRASTLQTIFGSDATRVANILIGQGAAALLTAEAAVQRQGAAADLAAAQNKGLAGAVDAIKSQFQTFAILIFKKVNPVLGEVGLAIAGFIDKLANGEGAFATIRKGILGVAAALGAIVAVKGITEIVGLIGSIVSLLGPFGLAIAAVGAVIGIATGGFQNFGDTFERLGEIAKTASRAIVNGLRIVSSFLSRTFAPVIANVRRELEPMIIVLFNWAKRLQGIFLSAKNSFDVGGFKAAITSLKTNLGRLGEDIGKVLQPLGRAIVDKLIVVRDFGVAIRDRIVAAVRSIDFGSVVSSIGSGISKVLSTTLGRSLTGAGIGAVAGGVIAGPLGAALGAAFGVAVSFAIPKLAAAISRIDVGALFGKFLDGVRKLGETIGKIISSKQFILGVAGIAAAAAAIGAQFVVGFVSGILSHTGDIAAAGATILNALFAQNSIVKAVLALAILLRKQIFGIFTSNKVGEEGGKAIAKNVADGAAKELPTTLGARLKTLSGSTIAAFKDLGSKAAQGLGIALSAGLAGSALGGASSNLEKGLGIAGLAGSIAAGAAVAGPAGAIAAGGIGLLTTAISINAKAAADAKDLMLQYKDAILQTGDAGKGTAAVLGVNLSGASTQVKKDLRDAGFTVEAFNKAIQSGKSKEFLNDLAKTLQDLLPSGEVVRTRNRIGDVFDFLNKQVKGVDKSLKDIDLDKALTSTSGKGSTNLFNDLTTGAKNFAKAILDAARQKRELAADIRAEQLQTRLRILKEGAEAIGAAADVSRQKILDLANGPQAKTPEQGGAAATTDVAALLPDVSQAFLTGLDTALGSAQLENALAKLSPILSSTVQDGLGKAFTPAEIERNLAQVKAGIAQAVAPDGTAIPDAVKQKLLDGVAAFEAANVPLIINEQAVADLRTASAAGDAIADATLAAQGLSSGISVKSKADLAAAVTAGGDIIASADSIVANLPVDIRSLGDQGIAANAGATIHEAAQRAADTPIMIKAIVDQQAAAQSGDDARNLAEAKLRAGAGTATIIGSSIATGLAQGITAGTGAVTGASAALAGAADTAAKGRLGISSPSTVFIAMGVNTGLGLAQGMRSQTGAVNAAAAQMTSGAAAAAGRSIPAFNAIGRNIINAVATGIRSASTVVVKSVTATAGALVQTMQLALKIGSPSKVFMGIGEDVVKGLALGITSTTEEAVSAAEDVAKAVIEATQSTASRLSAAGRAAAGGIFAGVFESAEQKAKDEGFAAGIAVIGALEDITDTVAQQAVALWNAAAKAANERTPEEARIVARGDFTSLGLAANQEAIKKAVDAIKDIGASLIAQGQSADQAAQAMIAYRGALLNAAAAAGLNVAQVSALVDQLGLSNDQLNAFVTLGRQAQAIVGASPGFIPSTPAPLTPGPNAAQTFIINNEFATPFDDPQAVSLAVVNRLAQSVKR